MIKGHKFHPQSQQTLGMHDLKVSGCKTLSWTISPTHRLNLDGSKSRMKNEISNVVGRRPSPHARLDRKIACQFPIDGIGTPSAFGHCFVGYGLRVWR